MEKSSDPIHPALRTRTRGSIQDGWLSRTKKTYGNDLLQGMYYAKYGFPGYRDQALNMQQQAEKGYANLGEASKHLRHPEHSEFIMTEPLKAVRKSKVGGFCGSRLVKEKFDIAVDRSNGRLILIDLKNGTMKKTGIDAEKLEFYNLAKEVEVFKKKQASKEKVQEVDNPEYDNDYDYFAKLNAQDSSSSKKLPKKIYIYARDLQHMIRFSNTLMFGIHRTRDRQELDPYHKDVLKKAIMRHKIYLAEEFYKRMRKRCEKHIMNLGHMIIEGEAMNIEKVEERPVLGDGMESEEEDNKEEKEYGANLLRQAVIRAHLKSRIDHLRRYNRFIESKKKFDEEMKLSVERVYVINRGGGLEGTLPEYYAGFTRKNVNMDNFKPNMLESTKRVILVPISKENRNQHGMFMVSDETKNLHAVREEGYLVFYSVDKFSEKITAIGVKKVDAGLKRVTMMEMKTTEGPKVIHSILTYIRHDKKNAGEVDVPELRALLSPWNYGNMKRLDTISHQDHGLKRLINDKGAGIKYITMRSQLMSEYKLNNKVSEIERNTYQYDEWEQFEELVQGVYERNRDNTHVIKNEGELIEKLRKLDPNLRARAGNNGQDELKNFLFFSRQNWSKVPDMMKIIPKYEASMVIGPPDHLCMPVWYSLGKVELIKMMAKTLIQSKSRSDNSRNSDSTACYNYLRKEGIKLLEENDSLRLDIEKVASERELSGQKKLMMKNVVSAYLQYSKLMSESSSKKGGFLMKRFALRNVYGLINISLELSILQKKWETYNGGRHRRKAVQEEDCLWLLLSIAFIFLPEHFLIPVGDPEQKKESDNESEEDKMLENNANQLLQDLGVDLRKYQHNKIFESVRAAGNVKLSLILSYIVQEVHPKLHEKMTEYGFPFLTFTLEACDSLFTNIFNRSKLYKIWNLLFFEGAARRKRRAQQIILCVMLALIENCKRRLYKSKTSDEMIWQLRAYGMLDFRDEEFLRKVLDLRKKYFVYDSKKDEGAPEEENFMDKISKGFKSFFKKEFKLERDIHTIYNEYKKRFVPIAENNKNYMDIMEDFTKLRLKKNMPKMTGDDYIYFFNNLDEHVDNSKRKRILVFKDEINGKKIALGDKKGPVVLNYGITHIEFGDQMTQGNEIEIGLSFSSQRRIISSDNLNWYKLIKEKIDFESYNQNPIIKFTFKGVGLDKSRNSFPSAKIDLDQVEPNTNFYKHIQIDSMWILVFLRIDSPINHKKVDFRKIDEEFIHLKRPFTKYLSYLMNIKGQAPYSNVLLNIPIAKPVCNSILSALYGVEGEMNESWMNPIDNDIYSTGKTTLFEFLVKTIVFSHVNNKDKIRCLYILLKKLDMNNTGNSVKESHVCFLIWYLLRIALIYVPYDEVSEKVQRLKYSMSGGILSARFINKDSGHVTDLTDMMSTWLTTVRKYTYANLLKLGENGKLTQLKACMKNWHGEKKKIMPTLGALNVLDIFYVNGKRTKKIKVEFDSEFNVRTPIGMQDQSLHCIVVQDSDCLINYSKFANIIARYQLLDWILSKDFQDAANSLNRASADLTSAKLKLNIQFIIDRTTVCTATVTTGKSEELIYSIDSKTYPIISYIANHTHEYQAGVEEVNLGTKAGMRNTYSLVSILEAVKYTAIKAIAGGVNKDLFSYKHKKQCLGILYMDIENSEIKIDGETVEPQRTDLPIGELVIGAGNTANIEVLSDSNSRKIHYDHFAKDLFKYDGVSPDNPFIPCHLIRKDERVATVIFENDRMPKDVPVDDVIFDIGY